MRKGDVAGLVIVMLLLLGLGAFFVYAPQAPQEIYAPVEITGSSLSTGTVVDEHTVQVSAELKQPGFVTVHQAVGAAPGPLVGQTDLLAPGSYPELHVPTTAALQPPGEYLLLLFVDNGNHVFEPGIDLPVMSDGQVVKQPVNL